MIMFEIIRLKCDWLYNKENSVNFHFLLKYLLHPMGVIEVPYGCNRTPSDESGVNVRYSTPKDVLQTPFF